ncbi:PP2C family protein-serine/threonine phosphatase, partial [Acidobacteriota bacterium]
SKQGLELAFQRGFKVEENDLNTLAESPFESLGVSEVCALGEIPESLDKRVAAMFQRWGIHQIFPVSARKHLEGLIGLGSAMESRPFTSEDVSFVRTVGEQALLCLENQRLHLEMVDKERMDRELAIARDIQRRLLPTGPPVITGYDIGARAVPCREVGGDYYEFLPYDEGAPLGFAIADVSGKSVPASLLMAFAGASTRALYVGGQNDPLDLTTALNRILTESSDENRFMSFFYGTLSIADGSLRYVNAGHNPPFVVRKDGSIGRLETGGVVLGLFLDAEFREGRLNLNPGDVLALYTDGLTEVFDLKEREFGEDRLMETVKSHAHLPCDEILDAVYSEVYRFSQQEHLSDDATMIIIKRRTIEKE